MKLEAARSFVTIKGGLERDKQARQGEQGYNTASTSGRIITTLIYVCPKPLRISTLVVSLFLINYCFDQGSESHTPDSRGSLRLESTIRSADHTCPATVSCLCIGIGNMRSPRPPSQRVLEDLRLPHIVAAVLQNIIQFSPTWPV